MNRESNTTLYSFIRFWQRLYCQRATWLHLHKNEEWKPELIDETLLKQGKEVGDFAKSIFGEYSEVAYNKDLSQMLLETIGLMDEKKPVIAEASFQWENLFCSVDLLRRNKDDTFSIYEVKSSTMPTPKSKVDLELTPQRLVIKKYLHYYLDLAFQYYVLKQLGYNISNACLLMVNSAYEKNGEINPQEYFVEIDFKEIIEDEYTLIPGLINKITTCAMGDTEPVGVTDKKCQQPNVCGFFEYCHGEQKKNSIFNLRGITITKKYELLHSGFPTFESLQNRKEVTLSNKKKYKIGENQQQQIKVFLDSNLQELVEKQLIKDFLRDFTYPLYFLDFETVQYAIPKYDGSSPYEQVPFQYSLHVVDSDGDVTHREFLGSPSADPRYALAKQLVNDIPKNGKTIAYNSSFEKTVLRHLARLFPELGEHLLGIEQNMLDLEIPFAKRWYYTGAMNGSSSIKAVLPALFPTEPSLNYKNLVGVQNGTDAMATFKAMEFMSEEVLAETRNNMLRYCELDTFAMVKIFEKLSVFR